MMYESKMALAVKANGRVLRENKDSVYLPFGCEYSLLIKNLNSLRAIVKIWIDGTDVTEGTGGLIVPPNDSVDIERFIKNGNLSQGNKFKFIERTASVSNHRGNKIDDGLIRVEFEFEREPIQWHRHHIPNYWSSTTTTYSNGGSGAGDITCSNTTASSRNAMRSATKSKGPSASGSLGELHDGQATMDSFSGSFSANASASATSAFVNNAAPTMDWMEHEMERSIANEVGVTVPGAVSEQAFTIGSWFPTDGVKHVMVLRMLGEVEGQAVQAPVTVKHKPQCSSCGKVNRANAKFCSECGTGLAIV